MVFRLCLRILCYAFFAYALWKTKFLAIQMCFRLMFWVQWRLVREMAVLHSWHLLILKSVLYWHSLLCYVDTIKNVSFPWPVDQKKQQQQQQQKNWSKPSATPQSICSVPFLLLMSVCLIEIFLNNGTYAVHSKKDLKCFIFFYAANPGVRPVIQ